MSSADRYQELTARINRHLAPFRTAAPEVMQGFGAMARGAMAAGALAVIDAWASATLDGDDSDPSAGAGIDDEWFRPTFAQGEDAAVLDGVPFGTDLLVHVDDVPGLVIHAEVCEDMWVPVPPRVRSTRPAS